MKWWGYALGGLLGSVTMVGAGIWSGYQLNTQMENRFSFPARMHYKLNGMYNSYFNAGAPPEPQSVVTNRVILTTETVFLPSSAKDFAGGISSFSGETILTTDRLGKLFFVDGVEVFELDIVPPNDNRDALEAILQTDEFAGVEVNFNWMRFNDIFFYSRTNEASNYLFLSYTEWLPEKKCFGNALARLDIAGETPQDWSANASDWSVIARTEPCLELFESGKGMYGLEAGGRIDRMPDGRLAWSSGAYERADRFEGLDFENALGQTDDDYGKMMLVDAETGEKTTISKGLRNPQGVTVDPDGRIWASDHGMRGGDELNLIFEGANFGFPAVTYGTKYNRKPAGNGDRHANHDGYDKPIVSFTPSIAPSSALFVDGFHYAWDGDILIGALSGAIHRVHVEDGRAEYVEPIELDMRVRDMAAVNDGKTIVIYTDDRRVVYLRPDTGPDPMARLDSLLETHSGGDADTLSAATSTVTACLQCHSILQGVDAGAGPSLYKVCGQKPGSGKFENYSGSLTKLSGVWTDQMLESYISDPFGLVPDTNMGWGGIEDSAVAQAISKALCEL